MANLDALSGSNEPDRRQDDRMDALGRLTVGVAHDLNNLLTVILGYCDLLTHQLDAHELTREMVAEIHKAGVRGERLTRQLLSLARHPSVAPLALEEEAVFMDVTHEDREAPLGHEVVLLVDDEDALRRFAGQVLESCGYTVLEANDGQQALELAKSHQGGIDLLVSDLNMPGLGGPGLAELLREHNPRLKVLLISGHLDEAMPARDVPEDRLAFLQKPFTVSSLARKVREILDQTAHG